MPFVDHSKISNKNIYKAEIVCESASSENKKAPRLRGFL